MAVINHVILGVWIGILSIASLYLFLMPWPSLTQHNITPHKYSPTEHPIRVFQLALISTHAASRTLTCETNATFASAFRQNHINTVILAGYTYTIESVSFKDNRMQIRLANNPGGIYHVNTAVPTLPTRPTTLHVLAY